MAIIKTTTTTMAVIDNAIFIIIRLSGKSEKDLMFTFVELQS